jgi:hypothetical protein
LTPENDYEKELVDSGEMLYHKINYRGEDGSFNKNKRKFNKGIVKVVIDERCLSGFFWRKNGKGGRKEKEEDKVDRQFK